MSSVQTALSLTISNFRYGNTDQGFEDRPANAPGVDEICTFDEMENGLWSITQPDGLAWISVQPDGSLQARLKETYPTPGPWESFSREGNIFSECDRDDAVPTGRTKVQLIARDL